jgi:hypothetical protein
MIAGQDPRIAACCRDRRAIGRSKNRLRPGWQGMTRAPASATLPRLESMTGINTPGSRIV